MSATDPVLSVELGARPIRVLLLEDEPGDAALVEAMLRDAGLEGEIMWVATIADAVTALQEHRVDCILCDLGLPDGRGIDALDRVLEASGSVPVVVLTGHTEDRLGSLAVHRGAADYLRKGRVDADLLRRAVTYALGRRQVTDRLRESEERFRALFDNAPLGQLCLSLDGLVASATRRR
jgi:CheY-like chemotaxis protein